MILAKIRVTGVYAQTVAWQEIPARISGALVEIEYADPLWDKLDKTVVFRGCVTRDVLRAGTLVQIPPECVEMPGASLKIGVYGTGSDNTVAIPTLWADLGRVKDAADPSGDESTAPSLPVWAQLSAIIGDLDALETEAKASLVEAINEAATKGGGSVSEEEVQAIVAKYLQDNPVVVTETDPTVPGWAKQPQKPSYTAAEVGARPASWMPSASDVGADSAGTAAAAVSGHNTSADAHNDLRLELKAISSRLNAFLDSDDQTLDELSEIVAYITSNKSLIDSITTSKVSVADIVDNLTTNVGHRPLSAAQGVVLKRLIDTVSRSLSNYQTKGDYLVREELPAAVNDALAQAKASGEFKGDPGTPGKDGAAGKDGYTPVKGVDYFDGKDGQNGSPGKDGTSVTVKSVSESNADGGNNVVTFSDGKTLTVKNGSKGSTGERGERGETGKTAYEYAKDGGYAGTEAEFAAKLAEEMPDKLPNPNALTVDGKTYDGSEKVEVTFPTKLPNPAALTINGNRYDGSKSLFLDVQERTFYELPGAVLAADTAVTSGQYAWINYNAVNGYEDAQVVYDGVTYVCPITFKKSITEYGDESYFYIGNWNNSAPEYPFFIFGYINSDAATVNVGSGTHIISFTLEPFVKKIDPKFLPSGGKVIIPETSIPLDGNAMWTGKGSHLAVGTKYIVTIDGVEYEREAKYSELWECNYVGSIYLFENGAPEDASDDNFCLVTYEDGTVTLAMTIADYANKTVTLSVKEKASGGSGGGAQPDWNAAEGEPGHILNRTHWAKYKEEEIANGEFTSQYLADMGVFAINLNYDYNIGLHGFLRRLPNKLTVEFDGVTYADRAVTPINDMGNAVGNLFYLNTIAGTSFPNTGEPFLMFVSYGGATIMLLDTQPTTHSIRMYSVGLCYKKPIAEYSAEIPMIDLTKYITSLVVDSPVRITSGDYQKDVYEVLASYDTVKIKYKYSGGWDGTVVAHPIEYGGIAEIHIRCLITDTTDLGYKILSIRARTDYVDVKIYEGK